jgi:hypothetical protein
MFKFWTRYLVKVVIPGAAQPRPGIHRLLVTLWIPASAGMTGKNLIIEYNGFGGTKLFLTKKMSSLPGLYGLGWPALL